MSKVPLASRLDKLEATANTDIANLVSDLARQDQRAAEKAKAKFTSRLQANMQFFRNLGLDKYGRADRDRLIRVNDSTTGVEWLNTPMRQELARRRCKIGFNCGAAHFTHRRAQDSS